MSEGYNRVCIYVRNDVDARIREVVPGRGYSAVIALMVERAFEAGLMPSFEEAAAHATLRENANREVGLLSKPPKEKKPRAPKKLAEPVEEFGADLEEFGA